ncbi:3-oxo-5-alpha-steroid 4-dehydrogenase 1 isoform X5 [Chrysemys picta bellii]|uniref:3-oxo-5-alpha-steroid 4-dehydrogenase 1 isoform X5 n=1 Tax=Chrysemys picta bellii TaxID=8478 RepID=UPI0032B272CD
MEATGGLWQRLSGPEERRLLEILSYGLVGAGALSALLLRFVRMPYGRYSTRRFGCPVPVRLAWALQELPSLLVPLGLSLFSGAARVSKWPNRVLLALFIGHYAHRRHTTASMEPAQITAAVMSTVNTTRIILQYMQHQKLQQQARRRQQRGDGSDEDMDTDFSQSTVPGNLDIMVVMGQVHAVERRFWAGETSTDWWDRIVLQVSDNSQWLRNFCMRKGTSVEL